MTQICTFHDISANSAVASAHSLMSLRTVAVKNYCSFSSFLFFDPTGFDASSDKFLLTIFALRLNFFMVVDLSWFQVDDVKNPQSEPSTASTTNSTFNYRRDNPRNSPRVI